LQCVAVCCSVLQCVAVCCRVLQCVAGCCSVLQCAQCDTVCCTVLLNLLPVLLWIRISRRGCFRCEFFLNRIFFFIGSLIHLLSVLLYILIHKSTHTKNPHPQKHTTIDLIKSEEEEVFLWILIYGSTHNTILIHKSTHNRFDKIRKRRRSLSVNPRLRKHTK